MLCSCQGLVVTPIPKYFKTILLPSLVNKRKSGDEISEMLSLMSHIGQICMRCVENSCFPAVILKTININAVEFHNATTDALTQRFHLMWPTLMRYIRDSNCVIIFHKKRISVGGPLSSRPMGNVPNLNQSKWLPNVIKRIKKTYF